MLPTRSAAGGSLCDPAVVERVVGEAPLRIAELIEWGTRFDHAGNHLALGREGGHGHDRIVHALGDATGREIMRVMIDRVQTGGQHRAFGRTPSRSTC